jgi:hypothetical protein
MLTGADPPCAAASHEGSPERSLADPVEDRRVTLSGCAGTAHQVGTASPAAPRPGPCTRPRTGRCRGQPADPAAPPAPLPRAGDTGRLRRVKPCRPTATDRADSARITLEEPAAPASHIQRRKGRRQGNNLGGAVILPESPCEATSGATDPGPGGRVLVRFGDCAREHGRRRRLPSGSHEHLTNHRDPHRPGQLPIRGEPHTRPQRGA